MLSNEMLSVLFCITSYQFKLDYIPWWRWSLCFMSVYSVWLSLVLPPPPSAGPKPVVWPVLRRRAACRTWRWGEISLVSVLSSDQPAQISCCCEPCCPQWSCDQHTTCPPVRPHLGSPCTSEGQHCDFGTQECCGQTYPEISMECSGGAWQGYYVDTLCVLGNYKQ